MRWTGIAISAPTDETERVVTQMLLSAGCAGVAMSGEGLARRVTSYLPSGDAWTHRVTQIKAAVSLLPTIGIDDVGEPEITEIDEEDWANSWKAYFKPIRIGRHLIVSPPWEEPVLRDHDILITIDPGMAFGTGTHATTQMCMCLLEDYLKPGAQIADIGTGSGILSIAASKLGASQVTAVDNDPLAVKIAAENGEINKTMIDVSEIFPNGQLFDLVVANIIADTLIDLADSFASIVRPDGILIVSGVIDIRQDDVRIYTEAAGFASLETRTQGEWVAMAFRRTRT